MLWMRWDRRHLCACCCRRPFVFRVRVAVEIKRIRHAERKIRYGVNVFDQQIRRILKLVEPRKLTCNDSFILPEAGHAFGCSALKTHLPTVFDLLQRLCGNIRIVLRNLVALFAPISIGQNPSLNCARILISVRAVIHHCSRKLPFHSQASPLTFDTIGESTFVEVQRLGRQNDSRSFRYLGLGV